MSGLSVEMGMRCDDSRNSTLLRLTSASLLSGDDECSVQRTAREFQPGRYRRCR